MGKTRTTNSELIKLLDNTSIEEIRERLAVLDGEAAALKTLLRSLLARRRAAARAKPAKEVQR